VSRWLQSATTQKTAFFIVTAAKASNLTATSGICLTVVRTLSKDLSLGNRRPSRDSNRAIPEYKTESLHLGQLARYIRQRYLTVRGSTHKYCLRNDYSFSHSKTYKFLYSKFQKNASLLIKFSKVTVDMYCICGKICTKDGDR
jgi:hypothetical protein